MKQTYAQTDTLSCFLCKHKHVLNRRPANVVHVAPSKGWRLSVATVIISSHQS